MLSSDRKSSPTVQVKPPQVQLMPWWETLPASTVSVLFVGSQVAGPCVMLPVEFPPQFIGARGAPANAVVASAPLSLPSPVSLSSWCWPVQLPVQLPSPVSLPSWWSDQLPSPPSPVSLLSPPSSVSLSSWPPSPVS